MGKGWFARRSGTARRVAREGADALPEGLWVKCPKCGEILFSKDLEKNFKVCSKCGYHHKLTVAERIAFTVDEGTFAEFAAEVVSADPLGFPDYPAKLAKAKTETNLPEGIVTGTAEIGSYPVVLGVVGWFMGGSMGSAYGEKVVRAAEKALESRLPLIFFLCSGGARMQEGILSLMQMAKTNAAVSKLNKERIPYITVLTDPTTAGVYASFASVGDIIIAEPGALIGFAGERVAAQAGVIHRPENFQRAEFQLENGMIDAIVHRKDLRSMLINILKFCSKETANAS